jgi:hypothetical protein
MAVIRCETTEAYRIFESIDRKGAGCFGNGRAQGYRKAVWPAFQGHALRELVPDMWRKSLDFANVVASEMDQSTSMIEFNGLVSRATLGATSALVA